MNLPFRETASTYPGNGQQLGQEFVIEDVELIRQMFYLLYRQYGALDEVRYLLLVRIIQKKHAFVFLYNLCG